MVAFRYEPVGRCIYCGSSGGGRPLTDEHIVPYALNGEHVLPKSSCSKCQKETARIENYIGRHLFLHVRAKYGSQTRRPKERPTELPIILNFGDRIETWNVPVEDHPTVLVLPAFDAPLLMIGKFGSAGFGPGRIYLYESQSARSGPVIEKIKDAEPKTIDIDRNIDTMKFGRFLSKIAHAYACAELGVENFEHSLPRIILRDVNDIHDYVGGELEAPKSEIEAISPAFYTLGLSPIIVRNDFWVAARIRLFGGVEVNGVGSPIYWIVVGRASYSAIEHLTSLKPRTQPVRAF